MDICGKYRYKKITSGTSIPVFAIPVHRYEKCRYSQAKVTPGGAVLDALPAAGNPAHLQASAGPKSALLDP